MGPTPMSSTRRGCAALGLLMALTISADGSAQPVSRAEALFREGRDALKKGELARACARFLESQRLDPAPGTLFNLADCESQMGRLADALGHLREAVRGLDAGDDRQVAARQRLAALERRVPRVTVRVKRGQITLDGREIKNGAPVETDIGDHKIVVAVPTREPREITISLVEAERREIDLEVGVEEVPGPHKPTSARGNAPPAPQGEGSLQTVGVVVGGAGLVSTGLGVFFALQAKARTSDAQGVCPSGVGCTGEEIDAHAAYNREANSAQRAAILSLALGGAAVATGVALYLIGTPETTSAAVSLGGRTASFRLAW